MRLLTEQIVFPEQSQNALMIDERAAQVQFFGDRTVAVSAHLQRDALNLRAQVKVSSGAGLDRGPGQLAPDSRPFA